MRHHLFLTIVVRLYGHGIQGVERPGKPGNAREFRCKGKKSGSFWRNKKCLGKVREFCCVKLIFNQSEHPNFKVSWGSIPLNSLGYT